MRRIFLGLAIWGAIHPMYYFITWFRAEGWSLGDMLQACLLYTSDAADE